MPDKTTTGFVVVSLAVGDNDEPITDPQKVAEAIIDAGIPGVVSARTAYQVFAPYGGVRPLRHRGHLTMKKETAESVRDSALERAQGNVALAARRLRELADDIERRAADEDFSGVIHGISWGFANLNLSSITAATLDYHYYRGLAEGPDQ